MIYNNEDGFTLIELIIVIAIIAIIGAMLIPNFKETTDRAKIKTDINGLRVIQNAIDLYEVETNDTLTGLTNLISSGYLSEMPKTQYKDTEYSISKIDSGTKATYVYSNDGFIDKYISTLDTIKIKDNSLYLK